MIRILVCFNVSILTGTFTLLFGALRNNVAIGCSNFNDTCGKGAKCIRGAFFFECMCEQSGEQYRQVNETFGECFRPDGWCVDSRDCAKAGKICCSFVYCDASFLIHECMEFNDCVKTPRGCGPAKVLLPR